MRIGAVVMLVYFAVFAASLAMPLIASWRHGLTRRAAPAMFAPVGGLLSYAFIINYVGWMETPSSARTLLFWLVFAVGMIGLGMMTVGWRAALRRPYPPGSCRRCGYDLAGLSTCPECGRPSA